MGGIGRGRGCLSRGRADNLESAAGSVVGGSCSTDVGLGGGVCGRSMDTRTKKVELDCKYLGGGNTANEAVGHIGLAAVWPVGTGIGGSKFGKLKRSLCRYPKRDLTRTWRNRSRRCGIS